MRLFLATVLAITLLSPVKAEFFSGNKFYEKCKTMSSSYVDFGQCIGFVEGVVDTYEFFGVALHSTLICIPPTATANQLVDVLVKYLEEHPEVRHYTAASDAIAAYGHAFPCAPQ